MKKLGMFSLLCSLILIMVSSAYANSFIPLEFDPNGGGDSFTTTWGWQLNGLNDPVGSALVGSGVNITTYTDLGADDTLSTGDTFTETFDVYIPFGLDSNFNPPVGPSPLNYTSDYMFIKITLVGGIIFLDGGSDGPASETCPTCIYDDTFITTFAPTVSTAIVYDDLDTGYPPADLDPGEEVATLTMTEAAPLLIVPSVFGDPPASSSVSFKFMFDTTQPTTPPLDFFDYFGTTPGYGYDLASALTDGWVFALTSGNIKLEGNVVYDAPSDTLVLGWLDTGLKARFQIIPEPTSMFLLGTGLVGLAGIGRRRRKAAKKA